MPEEVDCCPFREMLSAGASLLRDIFFQYYWAAVASFRSLCVRIKDNWDKIWVLCCISNFDRRQNPCVCVFAHLVLEVGVLRNVSCSTELLFNKTVFPKQHRINIFHNDKWVCFHPHMHISISPSIQPVTFTPLILVRALGSFYAIMWKGRWYKYISFGGFFVLKYSNKIVLCG